MARTKKTTETTTNTNVTSSLEEMMKQVQSAPMPGTAPINNPMINDIAPGFGSVNQSFNPFVNTTNPGMQLQPLTKYTEDRRYCDMLDPIQLTYGCPGVPKPEQVATAIELEKMTLTEAEKLLARWNFTKLSDDGKQLLSDNCATRSGEITIYHTGEKFQEPRPNLDDIVRILNELQNFIYILRYMEPMCQGNKPYSFMIGEVSVAFETIKKALVPLFTKVYSNSYKAKFGVDFIWEKSNEETKAKTESSSDDNDESLEIEIKPNDEVKKNN